MLSEKKISLAMNLRKRAGISQAFVAAALNVTEYTVRRWEKGTSEPSLKLWQVVKLLDIYGCTLEELSAAFDPKFFEEAKALRIVSETADREPALA